MSLYENWQALSVKERTQEEYNEFWEDYLPKEQAIYEKIIADPTTVIQGKLSSLADDFGISLTYITGFMDGINTSLVESIDMETLTEDSDINLLVDFEKLYYNMLVAQADWLYNLTEWDNVLTTEKKKEIKKEYNQTKTIVKDKKIGRNDPCPCGSGKKYKKCCLDK